MVKGTMEGLSVRRAMPADAERLSALMEMAYASHAAAIPDLPPMAAGIAEDIAERVVFVAEVGEALLGALVLAPGDGFMMLANVAVHPDARGTGIGKRLMLLAEDEARRRGLAEMRLNTHAAMADTIALYERSGWREAGRKGSTVRMRKRLSG